jgi:hypothetical protein
MQNPPKCNKRKSACTVHPEYLTVQEQMHMMYKQENKWDTDGDPELKGYGHLCAGSAPPTD